MKETISIKLLNTLKRGKAKLGEDSLSRVKGFVVSQRMNDESFMDKSGKPDIYYTVFGWMLSYVLGLPLDSEKMAMYLKKQDAQAMDLIHYAAYIRCAMIRKLVGGGKIKLLLHAFPKSNIRTLSDFEGVPHDDICSPYTQFVWLSLLEDTRNETRDKKEVLRSLDTYRVAEGGFSNMKDGIAAATNATAAALSVAGQLGGYKETDDLGFLSGMQKDSGGFCATEGSPLPDILSTATALFVLKNYNKRPRYSPAEFIEAHWLDCGGFSATLLEDSSDVEYTFYGLLALGTL